MILRNTTMEDLNSVMKILDEAIQYFKDNNIDQWQDGYPNRDVIIQDIENKESYVLVDNNKIIGTCMITTRGEPTYNVIDGKWLKDGDYLTVHRIALLKDYKGKGLASIILNKAIELFPIYKDIRFDTHEDNKSMQRFLLKNGFTFCGIITLTNKELRRAYQKLL